MGPSEGILAPNKAGVIHLQTLLIDDPPLEKYYLCNWIVLRPVPACTSASSAAGRVMRLLAANVFHYMLGRFYV